jgi:catechol 2,3-dioxygenase-like lactoylglutathione lyase family enzyme
MNTRTPLLLTIPVAAIAAWTTAAIGHTDMLPAPGFHHLHLNSVDPDAAIDFYVRQFASTRKTSWGGMPALQSPNNVLILFAKVDKPPATAPQTAIWHFGWYVADVRKSRDAYLARPDVTLLPLYTSEEGGSVWISTDTWPGRDGVLGLTRAQIADAKVTGVQPTRRGGFAYMRGPDDAIVEYMQDPTAERMNHVHFIHEQPFCAQLWYRKHLNAAVLPPRPGTPASTAPPLTEANCKVERGPDPTWPALEPKGFMRVPSAAVMFGDVTFPSYMRQDDAPLVPTRGHLYDHVALSVGDLDAWVAKLRSEGVTFLEEPYRLGDTRAAMIEGPSREAIELVEVK